LWKSKELEEDQEGCMSVPNLRVGPIERPVKVQIEALDLDGNIFVDKREGINARVSFHENDHLNGILHIDRLSQRVRKKIEADLQRIRKKYSN
jgi:peptide deformylase